jgi:hypothetical protein
MASGTRKAIFVLMTTPIDLSPGPNHVLPPSSQTEPQ